MLVKLLSSITCRQKLYILFSIELEEQGTPIKRNYILESDVSGTECETGQSGQVRQTVLAVMNLDLCNFK